MMKINNTKTSLYSSRDVEKLLEFDKIHSLMNESTSLSYSREISENFQPSTNFQATCILLEETEEGIHLIDEGDDVAFDSLKDIRNDLEQVTLGGMIPGQSLINMSEMMKSSWDLKEKIDKHRKKIPHLYKLSLNIQNLNELKNKITTQISKHGSILDTTSTSLKNLRSELRIKYENLTEFLSKYQENTNNNYFQSSIISTKNERLVLELKVENRKNIQGIVHDVSQSGSTLFIEPIEAVDLCNDWRETSALISREEEKILKDLSKEIASNAEEILNTYIAISNIDFIFARSKLSLKMNGSKITTTNFESCDSPVSLKNAKHPLLGNIAVPIDIFIGPDFNCLVITGPNTGGKTVALKTVGILSLMHQSGLRINADSTSTLSVFEKLFIDIGDQQDINNATSTFSAHIKNVIELLNKTTQKSLVLLDELGNGTDPIEGSALACAILKKLADKKVPAIITTHHRNVADFANQNSGCFNASVDLDPKTMSPTYKLTMGLPSISYAISIAKFLGMDKALIKDATSLIDPNYLKSQDLLEKIRKDRETIKLDLLEIKNIKSILIKEKESLSDEFTNFNNQQKELIEETRSKLLSYIRKKRLELRNAKKANLSNKINSMEKTIKNIEKSIISNKNLDSFTDKENKIYSSRDFMIGDTVKIFGMDTLAKIKKNLPDNKLQLLMGEIIIELPKEKITKISTHIEKNKEKKISSNNIPKTSFGNSTLDIRGMRTTELQNALIKFIDKCLLNDFRKCKIIHGVGKRILQQEVRSILSRMPEISSFKSEKNKFGEESITLIELK